METLPQKKPADKNKKNNPWSCVVLPRKYVKLSFLNRFNRPIDSDHKKVKGTIKIVTVNKND